LIRLVGLRKINPCGIPKLRQSAKSHH
jgi:hypothetical protein